MTIEVEVISIDNKTKKFSYIPKRDISSSSELIVYISETFNLQTELFTYTLSSALDKIILVFRETKF